MLECDSYIITSFNCSVCGKDYIYNETQIIYECEVHCYSKYHKDWAFVICPECALFMKICKKRDTINEINEVNDENKKTNEIEEKKEEININQKNENLLLFISKQFDIMGMFFN